MKVNIMYGVYVSAPCLGSLLQELTGFQLELKILGDFYYLAHLKKVLTITKCLSGVSRL